ncbi:hypothetical protein MUY27_16405 [Mucilaginibacter sp. RS28]|uniref:Uncharacterized protein n=1 Tax=Mucilaginibacter straminoryzae TaxID=2932774 RepID=A0A9X1X584_9SPHI|nr:hypothetical protein [Mucilaginibacter straminoryzae]MCJ8211302.1 hypothetical protein [Mucilaginibacter straminoryzae]
MNSLKAILAAGYVFIVVLFLRSPFGWTFFLNNVLLFSAAALSLGTIIFLAIFKLKKY